MFAYDERFRKVEYGVSAVGSGWSALVRRAYAAVAHAVERSPLGARVLIIQVKEKYGELRVYYDETNQLSESARDELADAIEQLQVESQRTCESCGDSGEILSVHGWLRAECDKHYIDRVRRG